MSRGGQELWPPIPREGSRATTDGILVCTEPDWCRLPGGGVAPFMTWAKQSDDARTAATVRQTGKRTHTSNSILTTCYGDEPGTGLGVKSNTVQGICWPKTWSPTVRAEGGYVVRKDDYWCGNGGNCTLKLINPKDLTKYPLTPDIQKKRQAKSNVNPLDEGRILSDAMPELLQLGQQYAFLDEKQLYRDTAKEAARQAAKGARNVPKLTLRRLGFVGLLLAIEEAINTNVRITEDERVKEECKCLVGPYYRLSKICGPICKKQAHHIVPDYTLRYGNREEGARGEKRVPGLPSFGKGAAICLDGNASVEETEHNEAHKADAEIDSLSGKFPEYPDGTAPIYKIIDTSTTQLFRANPECASKIGEAVTDTFAGINPNTPGRTTADRWPAIGSDAYKALSSGTINRSKWR